ncbi:MAG: helix-turn-helix domain-containing protein [Gammaproteobacteria bacterium]
MEAEPARSEPETVALQPAGIGAILTAARERLSMSREQVARTLHLPQRIVVALEEEDHQALPEPAYVKGYLRAYARLLEIDEQRLVEQYLALGVRDPEWTVSERLKEGAPNRISVGLSAAVVALVSVVLSAMWWNTQQREFADIASLDEPALEAGAPRAVEGTAPDARFVARRWQAEGERETNSGAGDGDGVQSRSVAQSSEMNQSREINRNGDATDGRDPPPALYAANPPSAAGRREPAAARQDAMPELARGPAAAAMVAAPDNGISRPDGAQTRATDVQDRLALRYRDDSWTEVKDATGKQLLYGMVPAGDARRVTGEAPFEVLLGNSRDVRLTINGEAFDPSPYVRPNNTARFTVDTRAGQ